MWLMSCDGKDFFHSHMQLFQRCSHVLTNHPTGLSSPSHGTWCHWSAVAVMKVDLMPVPDYNLGPIRSARAQNVGSVGFIKKTDTISADQLHLLVMFALHSVFTIRSVVPNPVVGSCGQNLHAGRTFWIFDSFTMYSFGDTHRSECGRADISSVPLIVVMFRPVWSKPHVFTSKQNKDVGPHWTCFFFVLGDCPLQFSEVIAM